MLWPPSLMVAWSSSTTAVMDSVCPARFLKCTELTQQSLEGDEPCGKVLGMRAVGFPESCLARAGDIEHNRGVVPQVRIASGLAISDCRDVDLKTSPLCNNTTFHRQGASGLHLPQMQTPDGRLQARHLARRVLGALAVACGRKNDRRSTGQYLGPAVRIAVRDQDGEHQHGEKQDSGQSASRDLTKAVMWIR